jgi:alkylation response protein AidB-like acyl-CoA dehydrogenase
MEQDRGGTKLRSRLRHQGTKVDFTLTEDQEALRQAVAAFLADHMDGEELRRLADEDRGFRDEIWSEMAGMGWTGLLVPVSAGGLGLGLVEAAVVLEEMGRVPLPGPYFSSAVLATLASKHLGEETLLGELASGARRGTVALDEAGSGDPVDRVRARVERRGGRYVASGLKPFVPDGHTADFAIVVARTEHGIGSFLLEDPRGEHVPSLDPTRKVARMDLTGRSVMPLGPSGDQTTIWRRVVDDASVAIAAELVGVADQAYRLAVEYAKQRVAFDRPIASFQAIKHKLVDMFNLVEMARVGALFAAWASDTEDPERRRAAAMAKSYAAEAAIEVTGQSIQVHGGVGFTWACDAHFFYKRAKQDDLLLGSQSAHRRRLAELVLHPA